jgi:hypothetical protein
LEQAGKLLQGSGDSPRHPGQQDVARREVGQDAQILGRQEAFGVETTLDDEAGVGPGIVPQRLATALTSPETKAMAVGPSRSASSDSWRPPAIASFTRVFL